MTPRNLTGWEYAKRFLFELYDCEYKADVWPERLGIEDLAALQAAGQDAPVYQAWLTCLSKAAETDELITHTDQWFTAMKEPGESWTGKRQTRFMIPPCHKDQCGSDLAAFEPAGILKRVTASADDFSAYLEKVDEAPSKYISAWFDAFGVDRGRANQPAVKTKPKAATDGADQKKTSQLHHLIWRVYQHLLSNGEKSTAQQVWNEIQFRYADHDKEGIIQEANAKLIVWCSGYGNEQTLSRSSFDKTLSGLKKNPPF
jgi:hypothetical protein